ncbi:uncharacterized protein BJ212DRAFT_1484236 [Suillus subaureus]|uniref:non-specific serine/threonine protein kinase n=1 Tax=Suillus subaureus TaxID=48587 RepID=A0A9P7JAB6_9AGAM|nr:uncharacterized protein BJ212DRAFT_1484236 [Suillus subaureus]KAG1810669.1 hypothetical protein BJ212DRAFT_1484236 [Suillus subaureus]
MVEPSVASEDLGSGIWTDFSFKASDTTMDDPTHTTHEFPPFYFLGFQEYHTENIDGYKPGGYHPVHLGDTFPSRDNPRYRVLHKLGLGSMSTVWLAKDAVENRWVTLKIVIADLSSNNGESAILQWLSSRPRDHPGAKHIVQDPVSERNRILAYPPRRLSSTAVECMPSGYAGTSIPSPGSSSAWRPDIHFGNIGFKIPRINRYTEVEMYRLIREPNLIPVIPHYHSVPSDSLPKYLVAVPETTHFMPEVFAEILKDKLTVEIIDFSNAFRLQDGRPLKRPDLPRTIRPPELTFYKLSDGQVKDEWDLPSDVWSMACTIWEIVFSDVMLAKGSDDDNRLIYETMKLVGPLPKRWKPYWNSKCFEDSDGKFTIDPDATWKERCPPKNDGNATDSVQFASTSLSSMVVETLPLGSSIQKQQRYVPLSNFVATSIQWKRQCCASLHVKNTQF